MSHSERDLEEERKQRENLERLLAGARLDKKDMELKLAAAQRANQQQQNELNNLRANLARVTQENQDFRNKEKDSRDRLTELENLLTNERLVRDQVAILFNKDAKEADNSYNSLLNRFRNMEDRYQLIINEKSSVETVCYR